MDVAERLSLIKSVGEEILTEDDLRTLLESKDKVLAYDGFEPSGNPHIAQGVIRALNVNKLVKAGVHFKMFVADWHAMANNKFGGDLAKIQTAGKYFVEMWKACGMDLDHVSFVSANDLVGDRDYWSKVMQVARSSTVKRITRCGQIMGRSENEALQASQIFYPCMQVADIFHMDIDIAQLGMDQRKVNVLAREVGPSLFGRKPVAVHHNMLQGLQAPPKGVSGSERAMAMKMSKSRPNTAVFMTDGANEVVSKMKKAYCPEGEVVENPVLEYYKRLVFRKFGEVVVQRPRQYGGDVSFASYAALEDAFRKKEVHPADVKATCARYVNDILEPVQEHFVKHAKARKLQEEVLSFSVTR